MQNTINFYQSYPFHSYLIKDQNQIQIKLGTDLHLFNNLSFSFRIHNLSLFRNCMAIILDCLFQIPEIEVKNFTSYNRWYEKNVPSIIEEEFDSKKEKPEHLREDLEELYKRKEELQNRIKLQLEYYDENKDKIEMMRLKKFRHNHSFFGFHLSVFADLIVFETLSPRGDIYNKLEFSQGFTILDDFKPGNAFTEISLEFYKDLNLIPFIENNTELILSSHSQIVDDKHRSLSSKNIQITWIKTFIKFQTFEFLIHKPQILGSKKTEISKTEIFDLINLIKDRLIKEDEVVIEFISSKNIKKNKYFEFSGKKILFYKKSENEAIHRFNGKVKSFLKLEHLITQLSNVSFVSFGEDLPHYIILNLQDYKLTLGFISDSQSLLKSYPTLINAIQSDLDLTIQDKIMNLISKKGSISNTELFEKVGGINSETLQSVIINLIQKGLILYDSSGFIRSRKLFDKAITIILSQKKTTDIIAGTIAQFLVGKIIEETKTDEIIFYTENFDFDPKISYDNHHRIKSFSCSCDEYYPNTVCSHISALNSTILITRIGGEK